MKTKAIMILGMSAFCAIAAPPSTPAPAKPAPKVPETVVKDFFTYLLTPQRDISTDTEAQNRWLTKSLRQLLGSASEAARKAAKARPGDKIDYPGNGTFLGAWDPPTSFDITASQQTPFLALVAIRCRWGPHTEYAGDQRALTVVLAIEDGVWRVSDIHTHAGKFCADTSLIQELQQLKSQ